MADAFLPNPAMNVGFTADVSPELAHAYAASFTTEGSALPLDEFTADILRTDGAARAALFASVGEGKFTDELAIVEDLGRPLAILHGEGEQLVNLDYLQQLSIPSLWRSRVQLIAGAGHAAHQRGARNVHRAAGPIPYRSQLTSSARQLMQQPRPQCRAHTQASPPHRRCGPVCCEWKHGVKPGAGLITEGDGRLNLGWSGLRPA